MRKILPLCFCTVAMTLLLGSAAYAWEAVDTNNDGVVDSIMFCDGYCLDMNDSHVTKISVYDPATNKFVERLYEETLNKYDEECRKNPGYMQRKIEGDAKYQAELKREEECQRQIQAKLDEIAGQCFNNSMTSSEKIQAALEYFKVNYPFDENAPDGDGSYYGVDLETSLGFLMKTNTRVLSKEERSGLIEGYIFGGLFLSENMSMRKYWAPDYVGNPLKYYRDPFQPNHTITYFIEGKLYSLNLETLEFRAGWTEEMKQSLLATSFCEERIRYFSNSEKYTPEDRKWIPEEFNMFLRDNGYEVPWMQ